MNQSFAERYGCLERWHWWFRGRQRILEALLHNEVRGRSKIAILSVGCGPAEGLQWLKPFAQNGGSVVGLDINPLYADRAPANTEFVVGDVGTIPFRSHTFDVVLALDVLEHLDDDAAGLREIARLRKPNGFLCVTVPALPSLWGQQDEISHHKRRYTRRTLSDVFARASLPRPYITYFNTALLPVIAAVRWARAARGRTQLARSDFEDTRPGPLNELLAYGFALERFLIPYVPLPLGVSLLATRRG
jgi:SAM-dependent methyltransferase